VLLCLGCDSVNIRNERHRRTYYLALVGSTPLAIGDRDASFFSWKIQRQWNVMKVHCRRIKNKRKDKQNSVSTHLLRCGTLSFPKGAADPWYVLLHDAAYVSHPWDLAIKLTNPVCILIGRCYPPFTILRWLTSVVADSTVASQYTCRMER
jgi:hypothetical protein